MVFIESICHDEELIERNIGEFKRSSPEYEEKKDDEAEQQYKDRITEYQRIYQVWGDSLDTGLLSRGLNLMFYRLCFALLKIFNILHARCGVFGQNTPCVCLGLSSPCSLRSIISLFGLKLFVRDPLGNPTTFFGG